MMANLYTLTALTLPILASAAPTWDLWPRQDAATITLQNLAITSNQCGGKADDCGNGPINCDADAWNAHDMDNYLQSFWDAGVAASGDNFDFHQAISDKFNVDLYCPDIFQECTGTPSSCSELSADTADEKEKGWLAIKAIMGVQELFLQWEKVLDQSNDGMSGALAKFQEALDAANPDTQLGRREALGTVGDFAGALFGVVASLFGGEIIAAAAAVAGSVVGIASTTANNVMDSNIPETYPLAQLQDTWDQAKLALLEGIHGSHSAAFSNGEYEGNTGGKITDMMKGGAFSGIETDSAYDSAADSIRNLVSRIMFAQFLQNTWKETYNAFYIYIPGVIDDCAKWKKNTGNNQEMRYCGSQGMYILGGLDPNTGDFSSPAGASTDDLKSYGDFNIQLQDFHKASASMYEGSGLVHSMVDYYLPGIKSFWDQDQSEALFGQTGMFWLPVCQLQAWDWKQSDNAGKNSPPCDCKTATDAWGNSFMNVATNATKDWINSKC